MVGRVNLEEVSAADERVRAVLQLEFEAGEFEVALVDGSGLALELGRVFVDVVMAVVLLFPNGNASTGRLESSRMCIVVFVGLAKIIAF